MERKEFQDSDETFGDFGQFMVVEETVITQGKSLEDSANLVITWGKLKLTLAEPRTSPNKRQDENKTKKNEMSGSMNEVVTDDAVKNKEIHSHILPKNNEHDQNVSITGSNNMTKSTYVQNNNRINRKKCDNRKNVDKNIGSSPLHIIEENYCTGEEESGEGWTNIPIIKTKIQTIKECL